MRRWLAAASLCLLCACSAPEPVPRLSPSAANRAGAGRGGASDARDLTVVWVGDREASGPLLVLLHGYGAPGDDLVPFARSLRRRTDPSLRVALPGAPIAMGRGRAWWHIDDGPRPADRSAERPDGIAAAGAHLDRLLSRWRSEGLSVPGRTVIAGFSQGGMLAMEVGLRSEPRLAGVASLSGGALDADAWVSRAAGAPPVFASHGRADPLLSFSAAERLTRRLERGGAEVTWLPFDGGHTIPPVVESGLVAFLARQLELSAAAP